MRIVFSRERPAQLDLLLRSLDLNAPDDETAVIYRPGQAAGGYRDLIRERSGSGIYWWCEGRTAGDDFDGLVRMMLGEAGDTVTFFCDDDVLFRPVPHMGETLLDRDPAILAFSLRLGDGNRQMRRPAMTVVGDAVRWNWARLPRHDFGYPASVDGHTFRKTDVFRMLTGQRIPNPTMLETILRMRCDSMFSASRPLMASFPTQALVGVDVNRVSDQAGVTRRATRHPQPAWEMARRFAAGERISLDALDLDGVDACHVEVPYVWRPRP